MSKSIEHNIFPDLNPRAEIIEKIGLIEKNHLAEAAFEFPDLLPIIEQFIFFRISGRKVRREKKTEHMIPLQFSSGLLASFYHLMSPLLYVISCENGEIAVYMGTTLQDFAELETLLDAHLGDNLFYKAAGAELKFQRQHFCSALTGLPENRSRFKNNSSMMNETHGNTSIDLLISGLLKHTWMYIVQSFPISRDQAGRRLEACAREIKDIKTAFQLRDIQKADRMSGYYLELLEKSFQRLRMGKQQGMWQTGVYFFSDRKETLRRGAAALTSVFSGKNPVPEPIRCRFCSADGSVSPFINSYHLKELQSFISLPTREFLGFRLHEHVLFDMDIEPCDSKPLYIGSIVDDERKFMRSCVVNVNELDKHAFVGGVTGSGKTNTIFNLLNQIYNVHGIPFLVIEPAKSEYRSLLQDIPSLLVFTLGSEIPERSAPFRINPFAFPKGIALQTHIDYLKAVFDAAFVMYSPMPYVLEECLHKIYEEKGWNLVTSSNPRGTGMDAFPTMSDLYKKIDQVVNDIGYQDRTTMDIKAALKTRIKNLCLGGKGLMLNTSIQIPFEQIMKKPVVLELKYLGNDEEKAFMMGLILARMWEHYESVHGESKVAPDGLKHITVIEEAHRLLKHVPTEKSFEEQSNIKGKGVETFCNLLSEIRAYGEGMLVSEQIPSKLAPDVIKNSNLKVLHRMVSGQDRDLMGDTMNLSDLQKNHLISIRKGTAAVFYEGLDRPIKVQVPLSGLKKSSALPDNHQIYRHMQIYYDQYTEFFIRFPACTACPNFKKDACEQTYRRIAVLVDRENWKRSVIKFFLPYLIDTDRDRVLDDMKSLFDFRSIEYHCIAAHLVKDYLTDRGNQLNWSFKQIREAGVRAQAAISKGVFPKVVSGVCREVTDQSHQRKSSCSRYCRSHCLYCHEGKILAQDPVPHNRMVDLIHLHGWSTRFYIEFILMIIKFLDEFVPTGYLSQRNDLAVCYMTHKLDDFEIAPDLQQDVLEALIKGLPVYERNNDGPP